MNDFFWDRPSGDIYFVLRLANCTIRDCPASISSICFLSKLDDATCMGGQRAALHHGKPFDLSLCVLFLNTIVFPISFHMKTGRFVRVLSTATLDGKQQRKICVHQPTI